MSKKRNRNKQHPDKAAEHHQPTHQNQASPVRPNPSAVNTATNENQWRIRQERLLERQVNTAKWTNIITASAAAAGLVGLVILWGTLDAAKTQATAAKIQAETARRELEISHRPWIASVRPAEIAEPFVFHDIGGVTFTLRVPIKNTGSSTAINVVGWPVPVFDKSVNMNARLATWRTGFNCNSKSMLESIASFVGGTPIPPGAEISYPVPQSANSTGFKPGDSIEAFVYLCIEYTDMLTAPPKRHHYCSVEEFVTDQGKREFIASGTVKGRFEFTNGGCAD